MELIFMLSSSEISWMYIPPSLWCIQIAWWRKLWTQIVKYILSPGSSQLKNSHNKLEQVKEHEDIVKKNKNQQTSYYNF